MYKRMSLAITLAANLCLVSCSTQKESTGFQEITIAINADKTILINDEVISIDRLGDKLQALEMSEGTQVNVQVEGDVEMGFVQEVLETLRSQKVTKISYEGRLK